MKKSTKVKMGIPAVFYKLPHAASAAYGLELRSGLPVSRSTGTETWS